MLLGAGFLLGCQNLPENTGGAGTTVPAEVSPIVTGGGDFTLLRNSAVPVKEGCNLPQILSLDNTTGKGANARATAAFECGDALFSDVFNELDGIGAKVGQGRRFTRYPRADLNGPLEWNAHIPSRITGPNAQACSDCHQAPGDGSGGIATHAVRDPNHTGDIRQFIERQTPALFGLAAVQLLAQEMTADIMAQANAAAIGSTVHLVSKGIDFGTGTVTSHGSVSADPSTPPIPPNVTGLTAVASTLIIAPFQWKGNTVFVRDFVRGASHNEIGMQGVEMAGENVDGDGDGVANEFTVGDMTAFASYMANQARPVTTVELSSLGLLTPALTATQIAAINAGATVFNNVGCNTCHTPSLTLNAPLSTEPSQSPFYRDMGVFPEGTLDPIAAGVDPTNPISVNLITDIFDNHIAFPTTPGATNRGGDFLGGLENVRNAAGGIAAGTSGAGAAIVRNFSDLRRHFMGANLAEQIDDCGNCQANGPGTWMTRSLWGVGSTAPYMHDGRATTLMSAILEHDRTTDTGANVGEARPVIQAARRLSLTDQTNLIAFLSSLVNFINGG
jgi:hypothetical protein